MILSRIELGAGMETGLVDTNLSSNPIFDSFNALHCICLSEIGQLCFRVIRLFNGSPYSKQFNLKTRAKASLCAKKVLLKYIASI